MAFVILLAFAFFLPAKSQTITCDKLHNGIFYYYVPHSNKVFKIIRHNSEQNEIDLETSDTSSWKVSWKESCSVNLLLSKTTKAYPEDQLNFMKSHTLTIKILIVTNKFYTFFGSIDVDGKKMGQLQDTMWFKPKNVDTK